MNRQLLIMICSTLWIATAFAIDEPRMRPSPYFGNLLGMGYTDIDNLGPHSYDGSNKENNDLLYTARAGYIDLGHLRESADRARYIFEVCRANLMEEKTQFTFKVVEPAEYHVVIEYPSNWNQLPLEQRYEIIRDISIDLGQHFAHLSTVWHEIVTWFGYSSLGLLSEKPSSFSWEDGYSDLLGTKLAARALRENTMPYDQAMEEITREELIKLDPQSREVAEKATDLIHGKWYSGRYPFLSMKKRNFDVGFDDGMISPFRVPGACPPAPEATCDIPPLYAVDRHNFTIHLVMTPHESERRDILKIAHNSRGETNLIPQVHFPILIDYIRKEAIKDVGRDIDKPTL